MDMFLHNDIDRIDAKTTDAAEEEGETTDTANETDISWNFFLSFLFFFLSLYTATRPRGHYRQVGAASVSIRQKKLKYSRE